MAKKKAQVKVQEPAQETTNELETLAPKPIPWVIGEKMFEQRPLRIQSLSDVMSEMVDIVVDEGRGVIFDQVLDAVAKGDAKDALTASAIPIMLRGLVAIPRRLPKLITMILEDVDEEFLNEHLRPRQAIQIIKAFVEQNEIGALIQDFFDLGSSLDLSVKQATAETEMAMEMEMVQASDSEEETRTEAD